MSHTHTHTHTHTHRVMVSREYVLLSCEVLSDDGGQFLELLHLVLQEDLLVVAQVTHQVPGDVIATHLLSEPPHQRLSLFRHLLHLFLEPQGGEINTPACKFAPPPSPPNGLIFHRLQKVTVCVCVCVWWGVYVHTFLTRSCCHLSLSEASSAGATHTHTHTSKEKYLNIVLSSCICRCTYSC